MFSVYMFSVPFIKAGKDGYYRWYYEQFVYSEYCVDIVSIELGEDGDASRVRFFADSGYQSIELSVNQDDLWSKGLTDVLTSLVAGDSIRKTFGQKSVEFKHANTQWVKYVPSVEEGGWWP